MTLKQFAKQVQNLMKGKFTINDNGTTTYSGWCPDCTRYYCVLMATILLQNQLGPKGKYTPRSYLRCPRCCCLPNRITLAIEEE